MAIGRPIELTPNIATKNISSLATADQTEFTVTGGYRINEIAVYRNGVRLADGRDFTASDGDTVNLVTAATVDDVIEFAVFDSFNVSDAIVSAASSQNLNGDFNVTGSLYAGTFEPGQIIAGIVTASTAFHVGSALTANAAGDVETIGIITAKSGVNVSGGQLTVGVAYSVGAAGVATAAGFVGPLTGAVTGNVTGNADTATNATNATNVTVTDESSDTSCYPLFVTTNSGTIPPKVGSNLTFNSSSGALTATAFIGNASTATALQTGRTIGGVIFDGTGDINLPGVNTAGNQNTTGSAATVTGASQSAITSLGTLTSLTVSGAISMTGTGAIDVAAGTTAQRPGSPSAGMFRYNSQTTKFEGYTTGWGAIGGGGGATGGGSDEVFVENDQTVTTSYTLGTNKNASTVSPSLNSGVVITIPANATLVIL